MPVQRVASALAMDAPRTRRAEQSETTRGALVDAARGLFAEHGYGQVGTEQIVAAARLTRGALYYHFEDKRDLFRAVFTAADADLVKGIADRAFAEEDPWQRLVAGCDAFLDACLDPSLRRIVFLDAPSVLGWREWHEASEAVSGLNLIEFGLQGAVDAGVLRIDNVGVFKHLVLGALNEAGMFIAHSEDTETARRDAGVAVMQLLQGLRVTG
jgi:AcrR family transcriptional regulator